MKCIELKVKINAHDDYEYGCPSDVLYDANCMGGPEILEVELLDEY